MGREKTKFMPDNDKWEILFFVVSRKINWGNGKKHINMNMERST